ncbi:DUF4233 domain-containing protein [Nakamurella deserti]|uniref:DUF4233 domain-containing protein n=1 Tax=Nakamurella deserti TaxID=2164074 RepID=UPI000DBE5B93|nr:DUF4233 domain-containing protein [Nakamurella deserti]
MIDPDAADKPPRRADPERGFRGVMSGALLLQSITVLLGLPVASSGRDLAPWELIVILGLAFALIASCAFVTKPWIVPVIIGLQVVAVLCWFITGALGIMGVIFAIAWWTLLHFRNEYRRRAAAGVLPSQQQQPPPPGPAAV